MPKNNQLSSAHRQKLDKLLMVPDSRASDSSILQAAIGYADAVARVENMMAVVSDLANGQSHIVSGRLGHELGLSAYREEASIWESEILALMSPEEREEKYIAELRFFHYLRHIPKHRRGNYYLISRLRLRFADGNVREVLHRMYYFYEPEGERVVCAVCLYGLSPFVPSGKSYAVDTLTGTAEELTVSANSAVLSRRERQVLALIDSGLKSTEIADRLNISVHTVSRHRQEILASLQVKNSMEACRIAKSMKLI